MASQELFLTQMLAAPFCIIRAIALSGYEVQHFDKFHLLKLTSSFSYTGTKFPFSVCMDICHKNGLGSISKDFLDSVRLCIKTSWGHRPHQE